MSQITVRRATKKDGKNLLALINALAEFEKLTKPNRAAQQRLLHDGFGTRRRFDTLLGLFGGKIVGYAIMFETYSSFRALPTLYLEDIFVLPKFRGRGIGESLFTRCIMEARKRKCGRMEWIVLDWNKNAIRFYRRLHAKRMKEWLLYRLEF